MCVCVRERKLVYVEHITTTALSYQSQHMQALLRMLCSKLSHLDVGAVGLPRLLVLRGAAQEGLGPCVGRGCGI